MITVYQWRVLEKDKRGRNRRRLLRWQMTIERAMARSQANMKAVEIVAGSAEDRGCGEMIVMRSGGIMRTPGIGEPPSSG